MDRQGKGYALDYGVRYIAADPPDVLVIIDTACRLGNNAIETLTKASATTSRPNQSLYLMAAPDAASINYRVAEFAWLVKKATSGRPVFAR